MVPRFTSTMFTGWAALLLAGTCVTAMAALAAAQECVSDAHGRYEYDERFDDVTPLSPTMEGTSASHLDCAQACLAHAQCGTFTYNAANGSCAGMLTRTPKQAEMTSAPGFRLYRRVPPCPTDQGYVYNSNLQLCLRFHTEVVLNCYGSVTDCASKGDKLAILRTQAEVNFAIGQVAAIGAGVFIIGAKKVSGYWKWHDGTNVESAVLSMASTTYDCLVVTGTSLVSMWTTNHRHYICRRDVTGF